jgi:hypothetical protein
MVLDTGSKLLMEGVSVQIAETGESTMTNMNGEFMLETSYGSHTLHFAKAGYTFFDVPVVVPANDSVYVDEIVPGYGPLSSNQYRIILTWEERPGDLEAKLRLPNLDTIDHGNKTTDDESANLEWDNKHSYATTITTQNPGTYCYSVANYSYTRFRSTPSAEVRVYNHAGLWKTYNILWASGDISQPYWRVFSLNGSTITELNTIAATAW